MSGTVLYRILHKTRYNYSKPVLLCHNDTRMLPVSGVFQDVLASSLQIEPQPRCRSERVDFFGNQATYFSLDSPHQTLCLTAQARVATKPKDAPVFAGGDEPSWELARDRLHQSKTVTPVAHRCLVQSTHAPVSPVFKDYIASSFPPGRPVLQAVADFNHRIFTDFTFATGVTDVATPVLQVLQDRRGVCQDFSHLAIACLRSLGFAAAYISGYLETSPPPGQTRLIGADVSHAWFALYIPDTGWIHFDPTNDQMLDHRYVQLAMGRDYADAAPLRGVTYGGDEHSLEVSVDVVEQQQAGA